MSKMKNKGILIIAAAIMTCGLFGVGTADANPGRGNGWGCAANNAAATQLDEKTIEAYKKFNKETQEVRKEMFQKQAELRALMQHENPDPEKVGKISGEIFDLKSKMQEKAEEAGFNGSGCGNCSGADYSDNKKYDRGRRGRVAGMMNGHGPGQNGPYGMAWK